MTHKAGFVNIIGKPNVGKSTLMNAFIGEKLSIITPKAQTTRHRVLGILNGDDYQLVFSDTPGVLQPAYKMQETMMGFVQEALEDADLFILMSEIGAPFDDENIIAQIKKTNTKVILLINKIDLSEQKDLETEVQSWKEKYPEWEVIPVSAEQKFNIEYVLKRIIDLLPESPPYYDKENLTDKPVRFFVGEIIREKILLNYQKEIPYAVEVVIESFKEEPNIVNIRAIIYTERDTQKGILIGHKGAALKKVGTQARIDIEKFLGQKVFLELNVKVLKNWRESQSMLSRFGYIKK